MSKKLMDSVTNAGRYWSILKEFLINNNNNNSNKNNKKNRKRCIGNEWVKTKA